MFQRILVVFEHEKVSQAAVDHAKELALRMDAEVTLLMLVEMAFGAHAELGSKRSALASLEERSGRLLSDLSAGFLRVGVSCSVALRPGDPGQELLKFMAERPPFHMVIWGSSKGMTPAEKRGHWLVKAAQSLECPLWMVNQRQPGKPGPADENENSP